MVDDACRHIPEPAIAADLSVEVRIHSLETGVHEARDEMTKVQLELNLYITELQLKAQPSTPSEIREQPSNSIATGLEEIGGAVCDCTDMLEHAFEVLTTF